MNTELQNIFSLVSTVDAGLQEYADKYSKNGGIPVNKLETIVSGCIDIHRGINSIKAELSRAIMSISELENEKIPHLDQSTAVIYAEGRIAGDRNILKPIYQQFLSVVDSSYTLTDETEFSDADLYIEGFPEKLQPLSQKREAGINLIITIGLLAGIAFSRLDLGRIGPMTPIWTGMIVGTIGAVFFYSLIRVLLNGKKEVST